MAELVKEIYFDEKPSNEAKFPGRCLFKWIKLNIIKSLVWPITTFVRSKFIDVRYNVYTPAAHPLDDCKSQS